MFRALLRVLLILVVIGALLWFFAPRVFNNAANSAINSASSAAAQVQGLAQFVPLTPDAQSSTTSGTLQVQVNGLNPQSNYEITLDQNQCGSFIKYMGKVTTDGGGGFYIEIPVSSLNVNQNWYIDVHQQGANGLTVACGQLETNKTSSAQVISTSQNGANVFGNGSQGSFQNQGSSTSPGFPNTGVDPGSNQDYDNSQYPRKY